MSEATWASPWVTSSRTRPGGRFSAASAHVDPLLAELGHRPGLTDLGGCRVLGGGWTSTGTATFLVGRTGEGPTAVLRMTATGGQRLRHETRVLAALHREPNLSELRPLLPNRRVEGLAGRWSYVLDDYLGGVDAPAAATSEGRVRNAVLASAVKVAGALHGGTSTPVLVDDGLLRQWIDEPIAALAQLLRRSPGRQSVRLERLRRRLRQDMAGRRVHAGWIHGDFWLGNLRVDPLAGNATGVIDWDCAAPRELPAHDLLHLALYGACLQRGVNLGTVVADSLAAGTWPASCEDLVGSARWSWDEAISDSTVLLLYWLRHVVLISRQQRDYVGHSTWAWRWYNIYHVLRLL